MDYWLTFLNFMFKFVDLAATCDKASRVIVEYPLRPSVKDSVNALGHALRLIKGELDMESALVIVYHLTHYMYFARLAPDGRGSTGVIALLILARYSRHPLLGGKSAEIISVIEEIEAVELAVTHIFKPATLVVGV